MIRYAFKISPQILCENRSKMWRDKLEAIAVKFRLTDSVHFEDRTVIYIHHGTVCME